MKIIFFLVASCLAGIGSLLPRLNEKFRLWHENIVLEPLSGLTKAEAKFALIQVSEKIAANDKAILELEQKIDAIPKPNPEDLSILKKLNIERQFLISQLTTRKRLRKGAGRKDLYTEYGYTKDVVAKIKEDFLQASQKP